jgi:hypothetical protein
MVETRNDNAPEARQRFAFTAVMTENGSVVARVLERTYGIWPQQQYGCFETWTQAQEFATVLNESHGMRLRRSTLSSAAAWRRGRASDDRSPPVVAIGLPAFLFAQFGDVCSVMAPVPGVKEEKPIHVADAMLRVYEGAREIFGLERAP